MAYDKKKASKEKAEPKDHRQELTDKIIETLENAGKWEKPWFTCSELPYNICTENKYKGVNLISLISAGFSSGGFATYNQLSELEKDRQDAHKELITVQAKFQAGDLSVPDYVNAKAKIEQVFVGLEKKGMVDRDQPIHVKKGEKGNPVFKAIQVEYKGKDATPDIDGDSEGGSKVWVQVYAGTVFNSSQINNINLDRGPKYEFEPHAEADLHVQAMIAKTGLKLEHNDAGRAYFSVKENKIVMPNKEKFKPGAYYDTLLHEIGHATGVPLGRDLTGTFGSAKYAFEELIAELQSVFMSAELGIPHNPSVHENHKAYMKSWLGALKEDKNMIFKAASHAQKGADFQNFIRNEHKLDLGLIKVETQEQYVEKQKPHLSLDDKKTPVLKKEKQLVMSM